MNAVLAVAYWLLPLVYLAVLIDYGAAFFLRTAPHGRNPRLAGAILFPLVVLIVQAVTLGRPFPATNYEVLAVLALALTIVYTVVEYVSQDRRTGAFVFAAVFLFQYTATVFFGLSPAPEGLAGQPAWAHLHILPAIVAYTGFTLAAIYGHLHLAASRNLKAGKVGLLFDRLPPLELLGMMCRAAIVVGFVFSTLAIITGAAMLAHAGTGGGLGVKVLSKIIAGSAAWLIYGAAIAGQFLGKWPAERTSKIAVYGFVVVIAMLVASIALSYKA